MGKRRICLWVCLLGFGLSCLVAAPAAAAERYRVKHGDSLYGIAKKFRVSEEAIRKANGLDGDALKVSQVLLIPGAKRAARMPAKASARTPSPADTEVYVVRQGDTLAGIAAKTGVPASEIRSANGLKSSKLKTGQRLVVAKKPARFQEEEDDAEEAGSIELDELASPGEDRAVSRPGTPAAPLRWKDPADRELFVKLVKSYEGVPYKLGGNTMRGIDCSAFTKKVYGIFSVDLPRTAREQLQCGQRVGRGDLGTGDLVFFKTRKNRIHVGIFLGGSEFFHLSSRNRAGKVDNIDSAYFSTRFLSGVRLVEEDRPAKLESTTVPIPGAPATAPPSPAVSPSAEANHSPGS
jgi:cell wall-associated NlpC family hydrolase